MKKIYTTISVFFIMGFFVAAFSQENLSIPVLQTNSIDKKVPSIMVNDTLNPPSWGGTFQCDTAFVFYTLQGGAGYAFGSNSYNFTEVAQKYAASGAISEVLVWYAVATGNGSTSAKVYDINASTKRPNNVLATSGNTVSTSGIVTTAVTSYTFSPAVSVTNNFAVAAVFPTTTSAGDSVCVVSGKIGCHANDSLAWIKLGTTWYSVPRAFSSPYDPNTNTDLVILPVIDQSTGVAEHPSNGVVTLLGAYPNPATVHTTIRYSIKGNADVSIQIFDLNGRVIMQQQEMLKAGEHAIKVALENLSAGNYYYTIKAAGTAITSKFSVVK